MGALLWEWLTSLSMLVGVGIKVAAGAILTAVAAEVAKRLVARVGDTSETDHSGSK